MLRYLKIPLSLVNSKVFFPPQDNLSELFQKIVQKGVDNKLFSWYIVITPSERKFIHESNENNRS